MSTAITSRAVKHPDPITIHPDCRKKLLALQSHIEQLIAEAESLAEAQGTLTFYRAAQSN